MGPIFTIGHSTHDSDAFAALLARHGVETLADVRRYPGSRRVPWTNAGEIERALPVRYVHLPGLGGRRGHDAFGSYAEHMASEEFAAGVDRLLAIDGPVAVMCAEVDWRRCHRRLLADALVARGLEVLHIDACGELERHIYPPPQGQLPV
jgi:uncharacterized protein (DUF488 family)